MMKLAIFAIVALSSVALAVKENLYERDGHKYNHAERLGVFGQAPFLDLYKTHAHAFVVPNITPRPSDDDTRYYRPSVDVCRGFFSNFVNLDYKISDFDQFVVLDACLGYVLEGHYKDEAENPEFVKVVPTEADVKNFDALKASTKISDLYQTAMRTFSAHEKTCVADLLLRAIKAKNQFRSVRCNNHMVQVYIQFAECVSQDGVKDLTPNNVEDPYVKLLFQLLKERVDLCFTQELAHIENAVRQRFAKSTRVPFLAKLSRSELKKQRVDYMWPVEIVKVLSAVQNTDLRINVRQVHQLVSAFARDDTKMKEDFLKNLAAYATEQLRPRRKASYKKKEPETDDPYGLERYTREMDELCNPFRVSTSEKDYSFALSLIRLVQLLKYPQYFHLSEQRFLDGVIKKTREVGPVYLATHACNMITYTQGTYSNTEHGLPEFVVSFKPDTSKMVVWPTAENL